MITFNMSVDHLHLLARKQLMPRGTQQKLKQDVLRTLQARHQDKTTENCK